MNAQGYSSDERQMVQSIRKRKALGPMNAQRYSSNEKLQLVHSIRNICIVVFRKHTITTHNGATLY